MRNKIFNFSIRLLSEPNTNRCVIQRYKDELYKILKNYQGARSHPMTEKLFISRGAFNVRMHIAKNVVLQ